MSEIATYELREPEPNQTSSFFMSNLSEAPRRAFSSRPRRHTFYLLLWILDGEGKNIIDFEDYPLRKNQFHLIAPGQVQHWEVETPPKGYYLVFGDDLLFQSRTTTFLERIDLLKTAKHQQVVDFNPTVAAEILENFNQILAEFERKEYGWLEAVIARLNLLLINVQRQEYQSVMSRSPSTGQILLFNFLTLVQKHAATEHDLSFYANELGVTSGHLSDITKNGVGKPAGRIVRERILLEAKRLLVYTDQTVAQIAEQLDFADASYFGRFFKRESGQTPRQFRATFLGEN